jgi:hypothetical protein
MKKALLCIVLVFIFSGCQPPYTHPIKDAQDFDHDRRECEKIVKHCSSVFIGAEVKKCLRLNGWIQKKEKLTSNRIK